MQPNESFSSVSSTIHLKRAVPEKKPFRLYPEDVIGILFSTLLLVLTAVFSTKLLPHTVTVRNVFNVIIFILVLAVLVRTSRRNIYLILRNWAPILICLITYENLGNLIHYINPHDKDIVIIQMEEWIFGVSPNLYLERFIRPWLSEIMHSFYTSYYPFCPIIGAVLYLNRQYSEFRDVMVSVVIAFYLGFLGYVLVPVVGPRFAMAHLFTVDVKGVTLLSSQIAHYINLLESTRRDCFPSLHTAITFLVTMWAFRYHRWLFYIMAPICAGLLLSTVYLRYHYVIDVVAGILLALFAYWIGPKVNRWWYRHITGHHILDDYPVGFNVLDKLRTLRAKLRGFVSNDIAE